MRKRFIIKICKTCKKIFKVYPSWRERKYCSIKCHQAMRFVHNPMMKRKISNSLKGKMVGEKNPNYVPKILFICEYCRKKIFICPSLVKIKRFCSRQCKNLWQKEGLKNINNPNWKEIKDMNPGCRKLIRKKILQRDKYRCRNCNNQKKLQIHHCNGNWKDNALKNLITLCKGCHALVHEYMLEPQIAKLIRKHPKKIQLVMS